MVCFLRLRPWRGDLQQFAESFRLRVWWSWKLQDVPDHQRQGLLHRFWRIPFSWTGSISSSISTDSNWFHLDQSLRLGGQTKVTENPENKSRNQLFKMTKNSQKNVDFWDGGGGGGRVAFQNPEIVQESPEESRRIPKSGRNFLKIPAISSHEISISLEMLKIPCNSSTDPTEMFHHPKITRKNPKSIFKSHLQRPFLFVSSFKWIIESNWPLSIWPPITKQNLNNLVFI